MKSLFTLLLLSSSFFMQAQPGQTQSGSLSIASMSDRPMRVVINGRTASGWHGMDNEVYLSDLRPGYYTVKIYQQKSRSRWNPGMSTSMELVYDSRLAIRSRSHVDIVINRFGRAFVDERTRGNNWNEWNNEWNDQNWPNQPLPEPTMEPSDFSSLLQTLRAENYDNTRLMVAKQAVNSNRFTAAQIKELVETFTYENSKLEMAKYAYSRCVDKSNYFIISQSFTYSSSKEELARYIQANP